MWGSDALQFYLVVRDAPLFVGNSADLFFSLASYS
jgi:hypothetical protein